MRLALQRRILASQSTTSIICSTVRSDCAGFYQHCSRPPASQAQSRKYTAKEEGGEQFSASEERTLRIRKLSASAKDDTGHGNGAIEPNLPDTPQAHAGLLYTQDSEILEGAGLSQSALAASYRIVSINQRYVPSSGLDYENSTISAGKARKYNEGWRGRLVTFEQYQHQSNFESFTFQVPRLVDRFLYAQDWELWLELILFRRRHEGAKGPMAIYKEIFRRDLRLPTEGAVANQLWDLLIQAGSHDSGLLEEILVYAMRLKLSTRRSWSEMYYSIISNALKQDPDSAYSWHVKLRDDFAPTLEHYQRIFKLSFDWGSSVHFKGIYEDTPLSGMYQTVILHLCKLQKYTEALKWHELLYKAGDFPAEISDTQPLLDHLIYTGDTHRFEKIRRQLAETKVGISNVAEDYAQRDSLITHEIRNRQLGEAHGIAPKTLSDSFCARLFATRFFSVDTIIKGLHIIATEVIGPLSLREIAFRDDFDTAVICYHIDLLRDAGMSLDTSAFCTIVRIAAMENKGGILKSVVDCDLHPDTFEDHSLQERLLAQYYDENDLVKIERTYAILTKVFTVKNLRVRQMNLYLRSQVTLGRQEKVLALLEEMKRLSIPVTARSSRHLRVCWLSRRQVGRSPQSTEELSILIQASQMTMRSGGSVSIIAWREILRRLGMAGRLLEVESLALWLVDWYSSPVVPKPALPSIYEGQALDESHVSSEEEEPPTFNPKHYLNILFTTSAQHAFVAWGFQHIAQSPRNFRRLRKASRRSGLGSPKLEQTTPTTGINWTWGLHLLAKLKSRGLPVQQREIARICRHRLNALFGSGLSNRKVNRRAQAQNSYSKAMYVRRMEEIWGKGLFRVSRYGSEDWKGQTERERKEWKERVVVVGGRRRRGRGGRERGLRTWRYCTAREEDQRGGSAIGVGSDGDGDGDGDGDE